MTELVYWDESASAVFWQGSLQPINPETGEAWVDEAEAQAWMDGLPSSVEPVTPVEVAITALSGEGLVANKSDFSMITAKKGLTVQVAADIPLPNRKDGEPTTFVLGFLRGNGSYYNVPVSVIDGKASFSVNFPENDSYRIDTDELNRQLSEALFVINHAVNISVID